MTNIDKIIGKTIADIFPLNDDSSEFTLTFTDGSKFRLTPSKAVGDVDVVEAEYLEW